MPGSILNADTNFPNLEGKTNEEKFQLISNYLFMLLEQLRYTLNNLGENNWNEEEMTALKSGITKESVKQVVGGLEIEATNGASSSRVAITVDGVEVASANISFAGMVTFSALAGSGTTVINGDNIKTGKIEGITLVSKDENYGVGVKVETGQIVIMMRSGSEWLPVGYLAYDMFTGKMGLYSQMGVPLKLTSDSNMSIDADGTIYIGTSTAGQNVEIGNASAGVIRINGSEIYIKGKPIDEYIASIAGG